MEEKRRRGGEGGGEEEERRRSAHLGPGEVSLLREEVAEARERAGDSVLLRLGEEGGEEQD